METIDLVFVRDGGFYTVPCQKRAEQTPEEVAKENAECNLGTLRVEDVHGNVLWQQA
jgi:hypothetical protein